MFRRLAVLIASSTLVACGGGEPAPGGVADAAAVAAVGSERRPDSVVTQGLPPRVYGALLISPGGFDLGAVDPNTMHEVRTTLTNRGPEPLTIVMTSSDCKCTVPESLDGTVIAPGQSVPMTASITMGLGAGVKEAKVLLNFKSGQQRMQQALVKIAGEVTMAVRAVPAYVDALKGVTSGTVSVASMDNRPFRIISAGSGPPRYADGFDPGRDKPRTAYTLAWELHYPASTEECGGGERLWWAVETDHPDCPVLPLRIRHECTGLKMDPTYQQRGWIYTLYMVNAGAVRVGEPVDLDIDVRRLDERATAGINGAGSLTPDATVEFLGIMEPVDEDSTVRIRFTAQPGTGGLLYAMAVIKSATGDKEIAVLARVVE